MCTYVHTGETFDRAAWVRANAEYPGFESMTLEDLLDQGDRAVARCRVRGSSTDGPVEFEVATFATARHGRLSELTEVWTDVGVEPPPGARPSVTD